MNSSLVIETLIETFPGWAYCVLLLVAFSLSIAIATFGMRALGALLGRMRRLLPERS